MLYGRTTSRMAMSTAGAGSRTARRGSPRRSRRPTGDPPRQEVVDQEVGEPDVRAGVTAGDRRVAQHGGSGSELHEHVDATGGDDRQADPVLEPVERLSASDVRWWRRRSLVLRGRGRVDYLRRLHHPASMPGGARARHAAGQRVRASSSTCPSATGPSVVSHVCASHLPQRRQRQVASATRIRISIIPAFEHLAQCIGTSQSSARTCIGSVPPGT